MSVFKKPTSNTAEIAQNRSKSKAAYKFCTLLGCGGFSKVFLAENKATGTKHAVKIINRSDIGERTRRRIETEIQIMTKVSHSNIVGIDSFWREQDCDYIVMELMKGGDLFDKLSAVSKFSEVEAAHTIRQVLEAVKELHSLQIVHRDLKLENLLWKGDSEDILKDTLKIADFGFARFTSDDDRCTTPCGTVDYIAPEIVVNRGDAYSHGVDIWSVGVILYFILSGKPPFYSEDDEELLESISRAEYTFPETSWDNISEQAKDLIKHMMDPIPQRRFTAVQALTHPWLQERNNTDNDNNHVLAQSDDKIIVPLVRHCLEKTFEYSRGENPIKLKAVSESDIFERRQQKKYTQENSG